MRLGVIFLLVITSNVYAQSRNELKWDSIPYASLQSPLPRSSSLFHYCPNFDAAVVYGGKNDTLVHNDTWLFTFSSRTWTKLTIDSAQAPPPRAEVGFASLPSGVLPESNDVCHIVIHGGMQFTVDANKVDIKSFYDDLWVLSVAKTPQAPNNWTTRYTAVSIQPGSPVPAARAAHGFVSIADKIYAFGGYSSNSANAKDIEENMFKLSMTGSFSNESEPVFTFTASWSQVLATTSNVIAKTPFSFRAYAAVTKSESKRLIYVYGGELGAPGNEDMADLWIFDTVSNSWILQGNDEREYIKNTMSQAVLYNDNTFIWHGGGYRGRTSRTTNAVTVYVYKELGYTSTSPGSDGSLQSKCTIDKRDVLWCISGFRSLSMKTTPGPRIKHSMILRGAHLVTFGGEFELVYNDMLTVRVDQVFAFGEHLTSNYAQSTLYFAVAALVLILAGFILFIINVRRRGMEQFTGGQAHYQGHTRTPGVPKQIIDTLPVFVYKKDADIKVLIAGAKPPPKQLEESTDPSSSSSLPNDVRSSASDEVVAAPTTTNPEDSVIVTVVAAEKEVVKEVGASSAIPSNTNPISEESSSSSSSAAASADDLIVVSVPSTNVTTTATTTSNDGDDKTNEESKPKPENEENEGELCPICLGDFDDGETLKLLPCNHFFHPECIDEWLAQHNNCPMCKRSVTGGGSEPESGPLSASMTDINRMTSPQARASSAADIESPSPQPASIIITAAPVTNSEAALEQQNQEGDVTPSRRISQTSSNIRRLSLALRETATGRRASSSARRESETEGTSTAAARRNSSISNRPILLMSSLQPVNTLSRSNSVLLAENRRLSQGSTALSLTVPVINVVEAVPGNESHAIDHDDDNDVFIPRPKAASTIEITETQNAEQAKI